MAGTTLRRLGVAGVALAGAVAVGLFGLGTSSTTPRAAAAQALDPFDDCDELRDWYVAGALPRVGPWGFDTYPFGVAEGTIMFAADAAVSPRAGSALEQGGSSTGDAVGNGETGTNVQEAGVDEPDITKSNGEILVTIKGRSLLIFDVSGAAPGQVGELRLDRTLWGAELLLVGDRVLAIAGGGGYYGGPVVDTFTVDRVAPEGYWGYTERTTIATIDISDPTAPTQVDERTLRASLISARQYDDVVRVVTSSAPTFDFVHPDKGRSAAEARQKNRQIVSASQAADWLPHDAAGDRAVACTAVSRPTDSSALETIGILTINPAEASSSWDGGEAIGVAADGDLVYSSTDRLYVASGGWGGFWDLASFDDGSASTEMHAFALRGDQTTYVASGEVDGYVQDRWAFSEYDGSLRVASTRDNGSESLVTVLAERGDDLVTTGVVGGMGKGEEIKSVRWFGDVAVVVTFRTVDPLYTLDLSDPDRPRLLGELKIPGFSEYLHPLGDDLLLGVGQEAGRNGSTRGSQVQSFDLSDSRSPDRLASLRFEADYSPVETDARVFTYLPEQRIAFVPTGTWEGGGTVEVVAVGADGALQSLASLRSGWPETVRIVPIGGDRIALVSNGTVQRLLDVTTL